MVKIIIFLNTKQVYMKTIKITLIIMLYPFFLWGQGNKIYNSIVEYSSNKGEFKHLSSLFVNKDSVFKVSKSAHESSNLFIDPEAVHYLSFNNKEINNLDKAIKFELPINKSRKIVELLEVPESFYDYEIVTSDGEIKKSLLIY